MAAVTVFAAVLIMVTPSVRIDRISLSSGRLGAG
jgi:hypothetical protein